MIMLVFIDICIFVFVLDKLLITVSHGSAYTVVRATYAASQWEMAINFRGVRTP